MESTDESRRETEALIEAIWGPQASSAAAPPDPGIRAAQNRALAEAMKAYLQQYLADS
ncbi:protein of unknown function [Beijerinckiaceae bacterium RH AL1]|nr:hypothetical protein [Beijerinckiaceae bacterium]VVB44327.1 protein of unknown function [Beijerinckiaceae bacterium RH CH11]VVB44407.1 protein of unknown function [Beijerinckiaceae bacterium RH AL8]VVC54299.1 protein of unknown function [Beijerinckiaceae bacterium RH AL1]